MILISRDIIEAHVSGLILSILEKDWVTGKEFAYLPKHLEETIIETLRIHSIYIKNGDKK
jgi:hypothetical protein